MENYAEKTNLKQVVEKWQDVLDVDGLAPIKDPHKRLTMSLLFENMQSDNSSSGIQSLLEADIPNVSADLAGSNSNLARFDPILISLIRRAAPMMIGMDACGVQPMTGPAGIVFALRSSYANTTAGYVQEALFNEANTGFSGNKSTSIESLANGVYTANSTVNDHIITGIGTTTLLAETDDAWPQMGFSLEKITAIAKERRLKADYTVELAQDLKRVNNIDVEQELSNIITTEITFEMNREIIRTMYNIAIPGGTSNTGLVNLSSDSGDINGRYFAEQWRGLRHFIHKDAIKIQKDTRRGMGNVLIVDAETASALAEIKLLDYSGILDNKVGLDAMPDETTSTFIGKLGNMKVFVDPYVDLGQNFYLIGYKGQNPWDAGMFFLPYIPLSAYRATNPNTLQPIIGYKTRYGLTENPFSYNKGETSYLDSTTGGRTADLAHRNKYYRVSKIANLI
jgi:hypothetical protein